MATELFPGLRNPYAVEVLGMPRAGKSGILDRYLSVLRRRNERYTVALIPEGAESAREKYADERYTDPFSYSRLAGSNNFLGYINALSTVNQSIRMAISDRGQIDRRVFRRALFSQGDVNPDIMNDENRWMYYMEYTPIQVGGVIMVMVRPEVSFRRGNEKLGPVSNMDFLTKLYEQYWRLHYEILQGDPFPLYTCIDAEKDREQVYKEFEHVMDTALTIQSTFQTT